MARGEGRLRKLECISAKIGTGSSRGIWVRPNTKFEVDKWVEYYETKDPFRWDVKKGLVTRVLCRGEGFEMVCMDL
jgi:hypothetical protein